MSLDGGLHADPYVHGVDHDAALVVDHQVERSGAHRQQLLGRLDGVQRDAQPSREVVAGAQRHQCHRCVGQSPARQQRRHHRMHGAVTAHHHHGSTVMIGQRLLDVVPGGGRHHIERSGVAQQRERRLLGAGLCTTRPRIGDDQHGVHERPRYGVAVHRVG